MRIPLALLALLLPLPALADPTTEPAAPVDKSAYNLFNPVPNDQLRDMDTDRPDKTDSPLTIDPGHFQLEAGFVDYTYFRTRAGGTNFRADSWSFGQLNLRTGLTSNVELDLGTTAFSLLRAQSVDTARTEHDQSIGDSPLTVKINLWGNDADDKTWNTAFGIIAQVTFPTASRPIGPGRAQESLGFPFSISLPADFSLTIEPSVQCERTVDNTDYTAAFSNGFSLGHKLFDNLDGFFEYWLHAVPHQETQGTLDVGLIYQLTPNLTLDTALNFGVNDISPRFEWTLGASFRF